jgi:hypothetical protein
LDLGTIVANVSSWLGMLGLSMVGSVAAAYWLLKALIEHSSTQALDDRKAVLAKSEDHESLVREPDAEPLAVFARASFASIATLGWEPSPCRSTIRQAACDSVLPIQEIHRNMTAILSECDE